jgi:hypothetical protein
LRWQEHASHYRILWSLCTYRESDPDKKVRLFVHSYIYLYLYWHCFNRRASCQLHLYSNRWVRIAVWRPWYIGEFHPRFLYLQHNLVGCVNMIPFSIFLFICVCPLTFFCSFHVGRGFAAALLDVEIVLVWLVQTWSIASFMLQTKLFIKVCKISL